MDANIYKPVQSLQKSPIRGGGMCSLSFFKIEDVQSWPLIDPLSGVLATGIQLKAGKMIYICQAVEKGKSFDEELKHDGAGPYMEMQVTGTLTGHNSQNILSLQSAQFHKWALLVGDKNGNTRLVGDEDGGATLSYKYSSGDPGSSRKVSLTWLYQSSLPAPIYTAQAFVITIGGITVTAGSIALVIRFVVGAAGAPMNGSSTTYTNTAFANKNLLVVVDGVVLPCDDGSGAINWSGSIIRHYQKSLAGQQITFVGGVVPTETIEIYVIS